MGTGLPLGVQNQTNQIGQFKQLIIGAGSNVFKANTSGIFCGQTNYSAAPLRWDYSGNFYASSAIISGNITATGGSITGSFDITTTGGQIKAYNDITSTHGKVKAYNDFYSSNGGVDVLNDINSRNGSIHAQNDIYTDHGVGRFANGLTVPNGSLTVKNDITSSNGTINAYNDITSTHGGIACLNDIYSSNGTIHAAYDIFTDGGSMRCGYNFTAGYNISSTNGYFKCHGRNGNTTNYTVVTWISGSKFYTHDMYFQGGIFVGDSSQSTHNI